MNRIFKVAIVSQLNKSKWNRFHTFSVTDHDVLRSLFILISSSAHKAVKSIVHSHILVCLLGKLDHFLQIDPC